MPRLAPALGRPVPGPIRCSLAVLLVLGSAVAVRAGAPPVAEVAGGRLSGVAYGEGAAFLGIPFAAPPVGPLRWRPPIPAAPWPGVRDASRPSSDGLQPDDGPWNRPMVLNASEDCLYLNIVAPAWPPAGRRPVIVFVHGGGNFAGGAWEHPAKGITLQDRGPVIATVNYRLGVFGFFSHPGLSQESGRGASGNYGLMDILAALRWVRANIASFGGDPGNVTLMGQSAGALDICLLMASPEDRGLFQRAIIESTPGVGEPVAQGLATAEAAGSAFAAGLGCRSVAELRAVPAGTLLAAAERQHWRALVPVDGWILRESPAVTFAAGREARVPMILGVNAREISFHGSASDLHGLIQAAQGPRAGDIERLYRPAGPPPDDGQGFGDAGSCYLSDFRIRLPSLLLAEWHAAAGAPVWFYLFGRVPRGREAVGAAHSSELSYVFGEMAAPPAGVTFDAEDTAVSAELGERWARFAATGSPEVPGRAAWPRFDPETRPYLEFGTGGPRLGARLRDPYYALFRRHYLADLPR